MSASSAVKYVTALGSLPAPHKGKNEKSVTERECVASEEGHLRQVERKIRTQGSSGSVASDASRGKAGKGEEEQKGARRAAAAAGGTRSPAPGRPIHSVPRWRPRVGRGPPNSHLCANVSTRRPRPRGPPPGAGGTRAGGRQQAGASGGASRGRAGGAGQARPSSAGPSRAAAGSDTCRAAPPRPLRAWEEERRLGEAWAS